MNSIQQQQHEDSKKSCAHCGQPVSPDIPGDIVFCCRGCDFVYHTIQDYGLGQYYSLKEEFSSSTYSPILHDRSRYHYMDDPKFLSRYVKISQEGSASISFYLKGVHCAACVWIVEKLPHILDGVTRCRLDVASTRCTLEYQPSMVLLSTIAQTLHSIGYTPEAAGVDDENAYRQRENRDYLMRLGIAAISASNTMLIAVCLYQGYFSGIDESMRQFFHWSSLALSIPSVFYAAAPFYKRAFGGLKAGVLHIDMPLAVGILGGFLISVVQTISHHHHVYFDSICTLIFLLLLGRYLHFLGVQRVRKEADNHTPFLPHEVIRLSGSQKEPCYIESIKPGEQLFIPTDSQVPGDGVLDSHAATLNLSFLTGESYAVPMRKGDQLLAGSRNVGEAFTMTLEKVGGDTYLSSLIQSSCNQAKSSSAWSQYCDRLGKRFVLCIFSVAILSFCFWLSKSLDTALNITLAFLVITCPCALGLSVPIVGSLAIARAKKTGILIRSEEALERLSECRCVCLDKTGTISSGTGVISSCHHVDLSTSFHGVLYELERNISHPIATAIRAFALKDLSDEDKTILIERESLPGKGIQARDKDGNLWQLGASTWGNHDHGDSAKDIIQGLLENCQTPLLLRKNDSLIAILAYGDPLHPDAPSMIEQLKKSRREISILSGDDPSIVSSFAKQLGISSERALGNMLPEDKAHYLQTQASVSAMVGDGINDAAAFKASHAAIGIRGGAESCLLNADVFLARNAVQDIARCFEGADNARAVITRNLSFSLAYNVLGGSLAVLGYVDPLVAAILMPLSSLTVITSSFMGRYFS